MKGFYKDTSCCIYYHDGEEFKGITFFNNKYKLHNSLFIVQENITMCDLILPNKNSFKKNYCLNEFVYFTATYITLKGKIIGFKDKRYEVESCISLCIDSVRLAHYAR